MKIKAQITGIEYKCKLIQNLKEFDFKHFNINELPSCCLVNDEKFSFGLSKWVSPKRTRSYPYERVYNTLGIARKITVIPIIKDEGKRGERDFIQWDTVSLMSLLDVFVIFAYYQNAEKHPSRANKITKQLFDNQLVIQKIKEIKSYHSSALHWNLNEIKSTLPLLIQKAKSTFQKLNSSLGVEFHSERGIDNFAKQFHEGVNQFIETLRKKAKEAQAGEIKTIQPKEAFSTFTKATIIIENYLGGEYHFTTNEIKIVKDKLFLIEAKHSKSALLPSPGDIKDGLLKMILYCNLKEVYIHDSKFKSVPVIKLTSTKLKGSIKSSQSDNKIHQYISMQEFSKSQIETIEKLLKEAKVNNFLVHIENAV